jgi:hypothetical protein
MSEIVKRVKVPTFSRSALTLADLCAKDLWRGTSFKDNASIQSDEHFLQQFASPFLNYLYTGKIDNSHISEDSISELIKVAGLKAMKLSSANTDIQQGLDTLYFGISKLISDWIDNNNRTEKVDSKTGEILGEIETRFSSLDIGLEATQVLGEGFFTVAGKKKTGSFVALASRLLFFALPQVKMFNYSTEIAKSLGLDTSKPSLILRDYTYTLDEGFERNWHYLREFEMPFSNNVIKERLWTLAYESGWWQRRVYDLALVIHLTGVTPRPFLTGLSFTSPKNNP